MMKNLKESHKKGKVLKIYDTIKELNISKFLVYFLIFKQEIQKYYFLLAYLESNI